MFIEIRDPADVTHLLNADEIVKVVYVEGELPMVVTHQEKLMVKSPSFVDLRGLLLKPFCVRSEDDTLGHSMSDARAGA